VGDTLVGERILRRVWANDAVGGCQNYWSYPVLRSEKNFGTFEPKHWSKGEQFSRCNSRGGSKGDTGKGKRAEERLGQKYRDLTGKEGRIKIDGCRGGCTVWVRRSTPCGGSKKLEEAKWRCEWSGT